MSRIEHGPKGRNPRFIVTNLDGEADELYERVYCWRGDMENRKKEQQLALFADRTSSTGWWTNQYRMLLAALAIPCDTAPLCESLRPPRRRKGPHWQSFTPPRQGRPATIVV